jgi:hypothetical protein
MPGAAILRSTKAPAAVLALALFGCGDNTDPTPYTPLPPTAQPPGQDPAIEQPPTDHWEWSECGSLALPADATATDRVIVRDVLGLSVAPDGATAVVTDGYNATAVRIAPVFADSAPIWTSSTELEFVSEFSADASLVAISGDNRGLLDAAAGTLLFDPSPPPDVHVGCGVGYFGLSHDRRWAAGGGFGYDVEVFDVVTHELVARLPSSSCNSAAAFSPDGSLLATARGELYRTSDWSRLWPEAVDRDASEAEVWLTGVRFTPDGRELLVTRCDYPRSATSCSSELRSAVAGGGGSAPTSVASTFAALSPDGTWIAADGQLQHRRGARQVLAPDLGATAFMPNGDVLAAGADDRLHRFCVQK